MSSSQTSASKASAKLSAWETVCISSARSSGSTGGEAGWLVAVATGGKPRTRQSTIHVRWGMVSGSRIGVQGLEKLVLQLRVGDGQHHEHVFQLVGLFLKTQLIEPVD